MRPTIYSNFSDIFSNLHRSVSQTEFREFAQHILRRKSRNQNMIQSEDFFLKKTTFLKRKLTNQSLV